ncbi:hypothetical protein ACO2Q2_07590 [Dyella sp. KRB-257]|uniref:hypothetical protein n=1 Tax=Dyella sp. KRB-257 TaxID=3400915 RepID=UPI003C0C6DB2
MMHFPRTALATELASAIQGRNLFGDAHNGLFLAAPRRTGKSTFLKEDLKPELERQGLVVVYVDLWSDQRRDPGNLISDAVGHALDMYLGMVAKTAKAAGLESISIVGALKIDTSKIGRIDGMTLSEALRVLHEAARKPVVLVIDEAQHALTSEVGEAVMAALKSARDQLNAPGRVDLMLVMSGSDRDKLLRLVNSNSAPFYGSQVQKMPVLGDDFIEHVVSLIEKQRPELRPANGALLAKAFARFGHRPQFFLAALGEALSPFSGFEGRFEDAVIAAAELRQKDDEARMESEYLGLRPLERAVLWRLLEQEHRFRPYDADALRFYQHKTGQKITAQKAQTALESLRQHQPPMVWKSARSEYAVDDAAMHRWYRDRTDAGTWPPNDPTA